MQYIIQKRSQYLCIHLFIYLFLEGEGVNYINEYFYGCFKWIKSDEIKPL